MRSAVPLPSLPFTVLGRSVREARPPEQRDARGDDEQAAQGVGVMGHVVGASRASFGDAVYGRDAGTGPGVGVEAAQRVAD